MKLNVVDNYFDYVNSHPEYKVIVYGMGNVAKKNYKHFGHIDFFCDQKAKDIENIENIPCLMPEELVDFNDRIIILISIKQRMIANEVCRMLEQQNIDAEVFWFFQNAAFPQFNDSLYKYTINPKDRLKIHIVYNNDGWILGKFAEKLREELNKLGQEVDITSKEDPTADVNHYVYYGDLTQFFDKLDVVRTVAITHVDSTLKRDLIEYQFSKNVIGICMSSDTTNKLSAWGLPRDKICYVNPAHDGEIKPKKIVLGITNRCYYQCDFRKRDDVILKVCEQLDTHYFKLKIMGSGWNEIVEKIRKMGFEVDYYEVFDREKYKELMLQLDYWIYYGFDEGAMGFLDALAAGIKTIATPQGYHLDTKCGLTYSCSTIEDFANILKQIQEEKRSIVNAVKDWTWENYAKKHLEIWQYLTGAKPLKNLYIHQSEYIDGIFSMLVSDISLS